MLHRSFGVRVVEIVVGVIVLALIFGYRWRQASAASDARANELAATRAWSRELRAHPALADLLAFVAAQGVQAGFGPPGPGQFEIVLLDAIDALGQRVAPSHPAVAFVRAWLEGPRRLVATVALPARTPHLREVVPFEWPDINALRR